MNQSVSIKSACCYCGTGCGVIIEAEGGRISDVRGDPDHPANFGKLCSKGAALALSAGLEGRARYPELRVSRQATRQRASWEVALDHAAQRFAKTIREHGPDSVAFYVSGQLLTEDYYAFNKLARGLVGTNNIDSNSRLCMSSAVAAYTQTLGVDAPPCSYEDIDHTDCLVIAGSNTAWAHPIVFRRIEEAKRKSPALKLIVIDPRRTMTARAADLHLAILPGTDVILFNAMLHVLLAENLANADFIRDHTEGFEAACVAVREYTPTAAAVICGVPSEDIITAARWFCTAKAALSMWCMGLNQSTHGTHNGAALIHLHLATGHIGRVGAGPFSLTGQPNAMGGREVGAMATLLPGHRNPNNPAHRDEVAKLWRIPVLSDKPGKTAVEMFEAVRRGEIRALWIACTNPAHSLPEQALVREALQRAEFVVVQDAYRQTETTAYADLLLPAASWGERDGTQTNSERRITRVGAVAPPPGEARPDWMIARNFAQRLCFHLGRKDLLRLFTWLTPEDLFREHAGMTRGRDLDISGLSYAVLQENGPQQWPYPEGATQGTARLYTDLRFATPNGRARFIPLATHLTAESTDAEYPLQLLTGRLRDQWHTMSRTGRVARLYSHDDEACVALHADDLARLDVEDGDLVRVASRRGSVLLRARASDEMRPGQVFVSMHWGRRLLNNAGANELTVPACDPISKQPELKHAAVRVEKAELPWRALIARSEGKTPGQALLWLEQLQPLMAQFDYASLALAGSESATLVMRLAHAAPAPDEWLDEIDTVLGMTERSEEKGEGGHCLSYRDTRRGIRKKALIEDGALAGVHLSGETAAAHWLKDFVVSGKPADDIRRYLFAPLATPPAGAAPRGRNVCACNNVSENDILAGIAAGCDLPELQRKLNCGTACGSCVPEIKRLLENGARKVA